VWAAVGIPRGQEPAVTRTRTRPMLMLLLLLLLLLLLSAPDVPHTEASGRRVRIVALGGCRSLAKQSTGRGTSRGGVWDQIGILQRRRCDGSAGSAGVEGSSLIGHGHSRPCCQSRLFGPLLNRHPACHCAVPTTRRCQWPVMRVHFPSPIFFPLPPSL
jgi:hypothetical protein